MKNGFPCCWRRRWPFPWPFPPWPATPSFSDISDPELREEVDILRMLGLVGGDGSGNFNPSGTLTRPSSAKWPLWPWAGRSGAPVPEPHPVP